MPRLLQLYTVDMADSRGGGGVAWHISGANGFLLHHRAAAARVTTHTKADDANDVVIGTAFRGRTALSEHANELG